MKWSFMDSKAEFLAFQSIRLRAAAARICGNIQTSGMLLKATLVASSTSANIYCDVNWVSISGSGLWVEQTVLGSNKLQVTSLQ